MQVVWIMSQNILKTIAPDAPLTQEEVKRAVKQEREWLKEFNAVSAVTDGPVEDMEGVPLPGDFHQGTPPTH